MRKLTLADSIPQSADAAWAVIGDFSGMRKWAPIVESETTEDTPQGKVRTLVLGGRTVKELLVDQGPHHYTYSLDRPDMKLYRSTVAVTPGPDGGAMIELTVAFEPAEGGDMTASTEGFMKFLGGNLKAMKRAVAAA
jgi:hypothetical protein